MTANPLQLNADAVIAFSGIILTENAGHPHLAIMGKIE
jgi:hypothetical protein